MKIITTAFIVAVTLSSAAPAQAYRHHFSSSYHSSSHHSHSSHHHSSGLHGIGHGADD